MSRLVLAAPELTSSNRTHSNSSRQLGLVKGVLTYAIPNNKSNATPGTCIFFDTETWYDPSTAYQTGQYQRLRLGVAIAGRFEGGRWTREKILHFSNSGEFWEFVKESSSERRPVWLFAHNIGFDLTVTQFPELLAEGVFKVFDPTKAQNKTDKLGQNFRKDSGFICLENPPVILSVTHTEGWRLICVDTFNYWVTSLEKMGTLVNKPKLPMPALDAPDRDWYTYCQRDVEVIRDAVIGYVQWIQTNNLGKFRFTAPSQALAALRHRWNKPRIKTHNSIPVRTFERQSYYGGRLQCFYIGKVTGMVYELDVTSLYPSVMRKELYPVKLVDCSTKCNRRELAISQLDLATIATVKLKTTVGFPKRQKGLGTVYPTGEYWTTLAGPELVLARELGIIREVGEWSKYELGEIFTGFVDFFWDYRQQQTKLGNLLNADLAKLLMNSLYGKFGQMTSAWIDRPDIPYSGKLGLWGDDTFADGGLPWFRNIGQSVQQFCKKQEHPYAFPAIAAYVTSYARKWMHNLMLVAGSRNTYYVVTDALFVNSTGYTNLLASGLIVDNELGLLRVKHQADIAEFETLHHYKIGTHKVSGSKKKSARANSDGTFTEIQFESFERVLMRKPDGSVHVKPVVKHYNKEYKRGTIQPDGWVKPMELWEK